MDRRPPRPGHFVPANDLERHLLNAQEGRIPPERLIAHLQRSQTVALFDRELPGNKLDPEASALVVARSDGQPALAVFTSLDRATAIARESPDFKFALLVHFPWLLRGVAEGVGIVVNPGSEVGLEMSPSGVEQLKRDVLQRGGDV